MASCIELCAQHTNSWVLSIPSTLRTLNSVQQEHSRAFVVGFHAAAWLLEAASGVALVQWCTWWLMSTWFLEGIFASGPFGQCISNHISHLLAVLLVSVVGWCAATCAVGVGCNWFAFPPFAVGGGSAHGCLEAFGARGRRIPLTYPHLSLTLSRFTPARHMPCWSWTCNGSLLGACCSWWFKSTWVFGSMWRTRTTHSTLHVLTYLSPTRFVLCQLAHHMPCCSSSCHASSLPCATT